MKKRTKIVLGVFGGLVVLGAAAVIWQWNNVQAVQMAMTMDSAKIEQKLAENEQTLKQAMMDYHLADYNFSDEEVAALATGDLAAEDAVSMLTGRAEADGSQPENGAAPEDSSSSASTAREQQPAALSAPAQQNAQEKIQQQVATMYVLQATFEGKLDRIIQQAIAEYNAGEGSKQELVNKHLNEIAALEDECDARVSDVISALKPLLEETGQGNDLIKQIQQTYANEKSLKKAYYMHKLKG